jgi:hypothetical protein
VQLVDAWGIRAREGGSEVGGEQAWLPHQRGEAGEEDAT